jgi:Zn-dependent protease
MRRYLASPLPIIIVLLLVTSIMNGRYGSLGDWFFNTLCMLPGVIIALSFHEYGHALVAVKCGDPTPKNQGRLTINPKAHVDPIGLACLALVGFGWGVPVQINPRNFRHPRRDELLVSLAGVAMNFLLAVVFMGIVKLAFTFGSSFMLTSIGDTVRLILLYTVQINIVLLVFNLIPVPPLDGFGILTQIFNLRNTRYYWFVYNNGFWILLALIVFNVTDVILSPLVAIIYNFILGIFF